MEAFPILNYDGEDVVEIVETHCKLIKCYEDCKTKIIDDLSRDSSNQLVFHRGRLGSRLLICAEGPGRIENEKGVPLIGNSGGLVNTALCENGIDPVNDAYYCNVLKYRAYEEVEGVWGVWKKDRQPTLLEMEAHGWAMAEQIRICSPDVIICLGSTAWQYVYCGFDVKAVEKLRKSSNATDRKMRAITRICGSIFKMNIHGKSTFVLPLTHPSYILRQSENDSDGLIESIWRAHFKKIEPLLKGNIDAALKIAAKEQAYDSVDKEAPLASNPIPRHVSNFPSNVDEHDPVAVSEYIASQYKCSSDLKAIEYQECHTWWDERLRSIVSSGCTQSGEHITVQIQGCEFYCFIQKKTEFKNEEVLIFLAYLEEWFIRYEVTKLVQRLKWRTHSEAAKRVYDSWLNLQLFKKWDFVYKQSLFGYQGKTKSQFLKVWLRDPELVAPLGRFLQSQNYLRRLRHLFPEKYSQLREPIRCYETEISPEQRYMVDYNLCTSMWWCVIHYCNCKQRISYTDRDIVTDVTKIYELTERMDMAPLKMMGMDIECSGKGGRFPIPLWTAALREKVGLPAFKKKSDMAADTDPICVICACVRRLGSKNEGSEHFDKEYILVYNKPGNDSILPFVKQENHLEVIEVWSEEDLLRVYMDMTRKEAPNIVITHNGINFDMWYLHQRAVALGMENEFNLGLMIGGRSKLYERIQKTRAFGEKTIRDLNMEPIIHCDSLLTWTKEKKEEDFSLNALATKYLKAQDVDPDSNELLWSVSIGKEEELAKKVYEACSNDWNRAKEYLPTVFSQDQELWIWSTSRIDALKQLLGSSVSLCEYFRKVEVPMTKVDLAASNIFNYHNKGGKWLAWVTDYCKIDARLPFNLMEGEDFILLQIGISRVTGFDAAYIYTKGQQQRIMCILYRKCRRRGKLIPTFSRDHPELHRPSSFVDFDDDDPLRPPPHSWTRPIDDSHAATLFQSTEYYDFCVSTNRTGGASKSNDINSFLMGAAKKRKLQSQSKEVPAKKKKESEAGYEGAYVFTPEPGTFRGYVVILDFNALYPSILLRNLLCYSNWIERCMIKKLGMRRYDYLRVVLGPADKVKVGEEEVDEGKHHKAVKAVYNMLEDGCILTEALNDILKSRSQAKKNMAAAKDPRKKRSFNIRQLALKLSANSLYGFLGIPIDKARLPLSELAAVVTYIGQLEVKRAKAIAESIILRRLSDRTKLYGKTKYGDTDSIMVHVPVRMPEEWVEIMENGIDGKQYDEIVDLLELIKTGKMQERENGTKEYVTFHFPEDQRLRNAFESAYNRNASNLFEAKKREPISVDYLKYAADVLKNDGYIKIYSRLLHFIAEIADENNVEISDSMAKFFICAAERIQGNVHVKSMHPVERVAYTLYHAAGVKPIFKKKDALQLAKRLSYAEAKQMAKKMVDAINARNEKPMNIEHENTADISIFMKKKRYIMRLIQPDGSYTAYFKGMENARRDTLPFTRKQLSNIINTVIENDSLEVAKDRIVEQMRSELDNLAEGRVQYSDFILSKTYSKENYKGKQEHVEVVKKMEARDSGSSPSLGSRIPYVLVEMPPEATKTLKIRKRKTCEISEDPVYAIEKRLKLDSETYFTNKFERPVRKLLELIIPERINDCLQPFKDKIAAKKKRRNLNYGIGRYVLERYDCAICGKPSRRNVCESCGVDEDSLVRRLQTDTVKKYRENAAMWRTCDTCIKRNKAPNSDPRACPNDRCKIWRNRMGTEANYLESLKTMEELKIASITQSSCEDIEDICNPVCRFCNKPSSSFTTLFPCEHSFCSRCAAHIQDFLAVCPFKECDTKVEHLVPCCYKNRNVK